MRCFMFERIISLIGTEKLAKIQKQRVLIVGLGGVGGIAAETLVRSGIKYLTIIDGDTFAASNLNRQVLSFTDNIGQSKVEVGKKYLQNINPDCQIEVIDAFLTDNNQDLLKEYDYIIDACDTLNTKLLLIKYAKKKNSKIITALGMGKKLDPSLVKITTLDQTYNDPLAKNLRLLVKKNHLDGSIPVVFSPEKPINKEQEIASMMPVPATAGIYLASFVINDIIK